MLCRCIWLISLYINLTYKQAYCCFQVIKDYDYDKDGKLNMAEYNQYRSDSSEKSIKSTKSIDHGNDNDNVNANSDSDEVVMVNLK